MKSEQKRAAKKGDGNGGPEISETPGVQPQPQVCFLEAGRREMAADDWVGSD